MTTEEKIKEVLAHHVICESRIYSTADATKDIQALIREEKIKLYKELMAKGHKWMDDCDNADSDSNIKCQAYETYVDYIKDQINMLETSKLREEGKEKDKV